MSTAAERQRALRERQRALGNTRVQLWLGKDEFALLDQLSTQLGGNREIVIRRALRNLERELSPQPQQYQRRRGPSHTN